MNDKPAKASRPAAPTTSTEVPRSEPVAAPYVPGEAGGDPDSRKRLAKQQLAAAETAGDDDAVGKARADLDAANAELAELGRQQAAQARGAAAAERGDDRSALPQGRTDRPTTTS